MNNKAVKASSLLAISDASRFLKNNSGMHRSQKTTVIKLSYPVMWPTKDQSVYTQEINLGIEIDIINDYL